MKAAAETVQNLNLAAPVTPPRTAAPTQSTAAAAAAAAAAPTQAAPVPVAGLAVEIAAQAQAGKQRFEIRLDPPELGRIDVRLEIDRDGHVNRGWSWNAPKRWICFAATRRSSNARCNRPA